ncbi:hypothetical protein B0O99DRAFT_650067 [Bisporella sp. PMI_857]|nr:hypothetical protein B0O99DRAFT_650067 [Bisporella sp. PMI_857]
MLATGLYGEQRKPKNKPLSLPASTSLAFSSTLTSLLSTPPPATTGGRARPSKTKTDIFSKKNRGAKERAEKDMQALGKTGKGEGYERGVGALEGEEWERSRMIMERKSKRYKAMKRGDEEGEGEGLVDFNRKWAQGEGSSSESEVDEVDGGETVEFEDEYGRLRKGTKGEAERMERRKRNALRGAEELDRMSARPAMPSNLIYGDAIQVEAFNPDEDVKVKMADLAKRRDRSLTPPPAQHYEADKEIRSKGVGFFAFSKDEEIRKKEMEGLEREREETDRVRRQRVEEKERRKREIEERRRVIGEKRARKQADSFLEGLSADFESEGAGKKDDAKPDDG